MKGMWQAASLPTALAATTFAGACALSIAVAWSDWHRLDEALPGIRTVQQRDEPGPEQARVETARLGAALARLPATPLFGTADPLEASAAPATPTAPADDAELPESSASFEIFGLIDSGNPARARAILGTSEAEQREYRVGEATPDGARLHAIRPRALVLERDGQLELMKMPEPESAGTAEPVRRRFLPRPTVRTAPPTGVDGAALRLEPPDGPPPD